MTPLVRGWLVHNLSQISCLFQTCQAGGGRVGGGGEKAGREGEPADPEGDRGAVEQPRAGRPRQPPHLPVKCDESKS